MIIKIYKFSAPWCGPCRLLKKELETFSLVPITEIDTDENEELCDRFNVKNIPLLVFVNERDEEVGRNVGFIKQDALEVKIKELNGI